MVVNIPRGSNLNQIAPLLHANTLIASPTIFRWRAQLEGNGTAWRAGEYALAAELGDHEVLEIVANGRVVRHRLTVPEGHNMYDIAALLSRDNIINVQELLRLVKDQAF